MNAGSEKLSHCEAEIQENIYGITLEDIRATLRSMTRVQEAADQGSHQHKAPGSLINQQMVTQAAGVQPSPREVSVGTALRELQASKQAKQAARKRRKIMRLRRARLAPIISPDEGLLEGVGGPSRHEVVDPPCRNELSKHENVMRREQEQQIRVADIEYRELMELDELALTLRMKAEKQAHKQHLQAMKLSMLSMSTKKANEQIPQLMASGLRLELDPELQDPAMTERLKALAQSGGLNAIWSKYQPAERLAADTQRGQVPSRRSRVDDAHLRDSTVKMTEDGMTEAMSALDLERLGQRSLPHVPTPWPTRVSAAGNKWYDS
ncbi:hypothetical protein B0A55_10657 [Friedmanniomyces simplex]|uniref:Uncharacterized protein n=1 Tax=Friedmanniomyces simplex TaxID=329884 RepID=A0A4U0WHC4_9PEZI|nr:hypothetical protein B0A55_10657 [Friedmanniomyces simplex]